MSRFAFLLDTYDTERLKTLSVWSQIPDSRMAFFQNGARVLYRYASIDDLLAHERRGGLAPPLPQAGPVPRTERP